jgi:hypothetical protein
VYLSHPVRSRTKQIFPDLDMHLTEELLALSDFAKREGPAIIEDFIKNKLPSQLYPLRDEISSFAMSLVPDTFDLILQQWDKARLSPVGSVNGGVRSESGYVSEDLNASGVEALVLGTDASAHRLQDVTMKDQDVGESQSAYPNLLDPDIFGDEFDGKNIDSWLTQSWSTTGVWN